MAEIYSPQWYEQVRTALNERASRLRSVPDGAWTAAVEIVGDGGSPYVPAGAERRFLLRIEQGRCLWYRESADGEPEPPLDYRFRGPASVFEEVAAGTLDPFAAVLRGTIAVRGDMRLLLRNAVLVKVLLQAYVQDVATDWPLGRPPYELRERIGA